MSTELGASVPRRGNLGEGGNRRWGEAARETRVGEGTGLDRVCGHGDTGSRARKGNMNGPVVLAV